MNVWIYCTFKYQRFVNEQRIQQSKTEVRCPYPASKRSDKFHWLFCVDVVTIECVMKSLNKQKSHKIFNHYALCKWLLSLFIYRQHFGKLISMRPYPIPVMIWAMSMLSFENCKIFIYQRPTTGEWISFTCANYYYHSM